MFLRYGTLVVRVWPNLASFYVCIVNISHKNTVNLSPRAKTIVKANFVYSIPSTLSLCNTSFGPWTVRGEYYPLFFIPFSHLSIILLSALLVHEKITVMEPCIAPHSVKLHTKPIELTYNEKTFDWVLYTNIIIIAGYYSWPSRRCFAIKITFHLEVWKKFTFNSQDILKQKTSLKPINRSTVLEGFCYKHSIQDFFILLWEIFSTLISDKREET